MVVFQCDLEAKLSLCVPHQRPQRPEINKLEDEKRRVVVVEAGAKEANEVRVTGHAAGWHSTPESLADEMARYPLENFILYSAHPMSTNPMGLDPETSVVDPYGKAHRMDGLYLADAGIFPTSLGVNPQLTTMTLATMIGRDLAAKGV